jgi:hypothetical protein
MFKLPIQYYGGGEEEGGRSTPPPSRGDEGGRSSGDTQVVKLGEKVATVDTTIKVPTVSSVKINTGNLKAISAGRPLTIKGDEGAEVIVNIVATSGSDLGKFYNFTTNSFDASAKFDNQNNLKATIKNGVFTSQVNFPASGGDSYNIIVIAPGDKDTRLAGGISRGGNVVAKSISRVANAEVTLSMSTDSAADGTANYATFPTDVTSTNSPAKTSNTPVEVEWIVTNASSDAGGFGLKLASDETLKDFDWDNAWYCSTTENVADNPAGDGEDGDIVTVADLTDLYVGLELVYHKGTTVPTNKAGSAVGTTIITAITQTADLLTEGGTVSFSKDVAFEDGETMTFRGYGKRLINKSTGLDVNFGKFTATAAQLTKTVRDGGGGVTDAVDGDSTTISLNGTYGIAGGNTVTYKGAGVDNSAANAVTSVSASSSAGSMVVQNAQTLTAGTKLIFKGCSQTVKIKGRVLIKKYPTSNKTIYLDLDKFITVGAGS